MIPNAPFPAPHKSRASVFALALALCVTLTVVLAADSARKPFDLPADSAERALKKFSEQAGKEVLFPTAAVKGIRTNPVHGEMTSAEALDAMLAGTELVAVADEKGGLTVRRAASVADAEKNGARAASNGDRPGESSKSDLGLITLESFEVRAKRAFTDADVDIVRTIDDAQPYYIFDSKTIERSGNKDLEDFLKERLTMNTQFSTANALNSGAGNTSAINLRGLGTTQTLILINGRRTANFSNGFNDNQSDVNTIPIAAVERIEVLPSSGSGIYGGSAVGGVVNIVLKRDYIGAELKTTYGNTFRADAPIRSTALTTGAALEGGKTNLMFSAAYTDAKPIAVQDRDFVQRGRAAILANFPAFFYPPNAVPYGSEPNIKSSNGSPLFGPGSANFTTVPAGYAGGGGLAPLQANAGKYNLIQPPTSQYGFGLQSPFGAGSRTKSFALNVRRRFTPRLELFADFRNSSNIGGLSFTTATGQYTVAANAPTNPFGQAIVVTLPTEARTGREFENLTRHFSAGFTLDLPHDWKAEGDFTWNFNNFGFTQRFLTTVFTAAVSNGTLDVLKDTLAYPLNLTPYLSLRGPESYDTTQNDVGLRAAGPLVKLPAGSATLTVGLEHRREGAGDGLDATTNPAPPNPVPSQILGHSQSINSWYGEAMVPLFAPANALPGIKSLDLQLAARGEQYEVRTGTSLVAVGSTAPITHNRVKLSTTEPTFGLRYSPVEGWMLRASFARAFLPPTFAQLIDTPQPSTTPTTVIDPRRGSTTNANVFVSAPLGNPNLKPETAKTWTAGVVFEPPALKGLRASIDYTRIQKRDIIATLSIQDIVNNESSLPNRVTRGPAPAGDPYGVGPITFVQGGPFNQAKGLVETYDLSLTGRKPDTRLGGFEVFALATWQTHYKTQTTLIAPFVENAGVVSFPLKFKANAGLTWNWQQWTVGWAARYYHSYLVANPAAPTFATVVAEQGSPRVSRQIYHDVFVTYGVTSMEKNDRAFLHRLLTGMAVTAGIKDVFNAKPPLDVAQASSYFYSFYGDPRMAEYYLSLKKTF